MNRSDKNAAQQFRYDIHWRSYDDGQTYPKEGLILKEHQLLESMAPENV